MLFLLTFFFQLFLFPFLYQDFPELLIMKLHVFKQYALSRLIRKVSFFLWKRRNAVETVLSLTTVSSIRVPCFIFVDSSDKERTAGPLSSTLVASICGAQRLLQIVSRVGSSGHRFGFEVTLHQWHVADYLLAFELCRQHRFQAQELLLTRIILVDQHPQTTLLQQGFDNVFGNSSCGRLQLVHNPLVLLLYHIWLPQPELLQLLDQLHSLPSILVLFHVLLNASSCVAIVLFHSNCAIDYLADHFCVNLFYCCHTQAELQTLNQVVN